MTRAEIEAKYKKMGFEIEYGNDKPGFVYEAHRHEQTYLYTLSGSLKLKLDDGEWQELSAGSEAIVGEDQLHEAVVGPDGWEYVAAWVEPTSDARS